LKTAELNVRITPALKAIAQKAAERDQRSLSSLDCGTEPDQTEIIIGEKGYILKSLSGHEYKCEYISVKSRFDKNIPLTTHTYGNTVMRIAASCKEDDVPGSGEGAFEAFIYTKETLIVQWHHH